MIKVTIAIPVYNVEPYIEKSLLSALQQDFTLPYEILLIDDKGSDNSMQKVHHIIQTYSIPDHIHISIIEHEKNRGLGEARNTAIENAKGQYLFFLDSDDWISADCISLLYKEAQLHNCDVVIGSVARVTNGKATYQPYAPYFIEHQSAGVYIYARHIADVHIEVWNKLYNISFLRANHLKCIHRIMEDSIFDFQVNVLATRIALIPNITLYYNIRENSILTSLHHKQGTDESAFVYSDIVARLQQFINQGYQDVFGIYDLYYQRLTASFASIALSRYTSAQKQQICNRIAGFNDFVPGIGKLYHLKHKILYAGCKLRQSIDWFNAILRAERCIFHIFKKV